MGEVRPMINNVLNFSLHLRDDKPFPLPLRRQDRVGIVEASTHAVDAAILAEQKKYRALIVVDHDRPVGVFFPEHLAKVLPGHHLVPFAAAGLEVSEIIRRLDAAGVDFHSEQVNIYIWTCPAGHVTDGNPCPDHGLPTTEY